jgi:4,5-DOPA dioxygenase extradiol
MNRKQFLATLALLPIAGEAMKLSEFSEKSRLMKSTAPMPALFIGHGSPMNAIGENEFTAGWRSVAAEIPEPRAILCISAHWETQGTLVTSMEKPRTIHDFGGFPQKLFDVQYPAPGSPELAQDLCDTAGSTRVFPDDKWGLDHGTWSVVRQMYPDAAIPVVQLSLDYSKNPMDHYDLGKELAPLREKGVLIIGSGNMVHNLRKADWSGRTEGFDWAVEANETFKSLIGRNEHRKLAGYRSLGSAADLAIPTPEHFLPLLYVLALKKEQEELTFFNDKTVMGSISMTSVKLSPG